MSVALVKKTMVNLGVWVGLAATAVTGTAPSNTRDSLPAYGQYEPVVGVSAGLLDASKLTDYNVASTQTVLLTDGAIIENKTIYGDITLPSVHNQMIILRNCRLRGGPHIPSSNIAVVDADNTRSGTGLLIVIDCEVDPQKPSLNRDGMRGNRLETYRCYIHHVIDGWFGYATSAQNGGSAKSKLMGSYIKDLAYGFPDYNNGVSGTDPATVTFPDKPSDWGHNDGTHNDCVVVGSPGVEVRGNSLHGSGVNLPGTVNGDNPQHPGIQASGYAYGQCVLITYTGGYPDLTSIVEENYMWGQNAHMGILPNCTAKVGKNKHYRAVYVGSTSSGYWIRFHQRAGNGVNITDDVWIDGPYAGQVLTEPQTKGIHYNA